MEENFKKLVMEMNLEMAQHALLYIASLLDEGEMPTCFDLYNALKPKDWKVEGIKAQ